MRRMGPKRRDWERHVATALELVSESTEPEPDHGRTEDAEEADTERGYEHSPRDHSPLPSRTPLATMEYPAPGWILPPVGLRAEGGDSA